jgi:hypothetical protein
MCAYIFLSKGLKLTLPVENRLKRKQARNRITNKLLAILEIPILPNFSPCSIIDNAAQLSIIVKKNAACHK